MTDRDDELARALGDLPVPDHAPDFWDRLDRQLATGGGADERIVPLRPAGTGGDRRSRGGAPDRQGRGRSRWGGLAAAAAVVVLAGGGVLVTQLDDDGAEVVTVAGEGDATTDGGPSALEAPQQGGGGAPAQAPAVDPSDRGAVEAVGPGVVVGALPAADGSSTVLVQGVLPGDERGCEGMPLEGLQVLAPDGSTRPVPSADGTAITNGVDVVASPGGGRVAVVSQCEGYLGQLLVGEVGPGGVPTDLRVVAGSRADGSPVPGAPRAEGAPSVAWTSDGGQLLLTTAGSAGGGSSDRALWSYDVASGTWSERGDAPDGVIAAVERRDGSLVAVTEDELVIGGQVAPRQGVDGLVLAPDGVSVAGHGTDGLLLIEGSGQVRVVAEGAVNVARFLPDGSWLAFSRFSEDDGRNEIGTVPVADAEREPAVLGPSVWGRFEVLPDGSGLLVTVDGQPDSDGFPRPVVERWAFAPR